jgi:hypothetical protein
MRLQPDAVDEAEGQKAKDQVKGEAVEAASHIKPFGALMGQGYGAAPNLEGEEAFPVDMVDDAGIGGKGAVGEQKLHIVGIGGRGDAKKEEDGGSKPDRRIHHPDKSQQNAHGRRLLKKGNPCQAWKMAINLKRVSGVMERQVFTPLEMVGFCPLVMFPFRAVEIA